MPQAIRKPTAKRRKRAAPLQASEPSRKEPPAASLAISHSGTGIAELAQDLADLFRLHLDMDDADGVTEKAISMAIEDKATNGEDYAVLVRSHLRFGAMQRHAFAKTEALQRLILELEPTTASETLSLVVLFDTALETFVAQHCDIKDDVDAQRAWQSLARALKAIVRGLIHGCGASSPILKHHTDRDDLIPWAEARSNATREAGPYLVTYDPARGCLKERAPR